MHKVLLTAAIIVLPLFAATPSFALSGLAAARACNANPACVMFFDDDGGVMIFIDGKTIGCPTVDGDCAVIPRVHGRGDFGPANTGGLGSMSQGDGNTGGTGGGHDGFVGGGNVGAFASAVTTDVGGGIIQ